MSLYFFSWLFTIFVLLGFTWFSIRVIVYTYDEESVPYIQRLSAFLLLWVVYLVTLSSTGIIHDFDFPPKMPLFVVVPALIIIIFLLTRTATSRLLENVPIYLLTGFQGFRIIVEVIIWLAYLEKILPVETTFEGYNYDVLVGLTAIPIAFYAFRNKLSKGLLIFWNVAGLFILANTVRVFIFSGFFPELLGLESSIGIEFLTPPLLFIAGIFMPMAVFIHALSLKKLLST